MKTAHILRKYIPGEWGGTETAMQQLATGLLSLDVASIVFCPEPQATSKDSSEGDPKTATADPLTSAGCGLRRYRACMPVWGLSKAEREQFISLGGNLHSFDLAGQLANEPDLDIIHTHVVGRLGGIAHTIARRRNIPFVVTIHGGLLDLSDQVRQSLRTPSRRTVEWGRLFGWWWGARRVLSGADLIVTCNVNEANLLKERFPNVRVITHAHGIVFAKYQDNHQAAAREAFPRIIGRQVVLCVARIDVVKNQSWLVGQMSQIQKKHPQALLVLAGAATNQSYSQALHRTIKAEGLENSVLLTGGLPPEDPRLLGLLQEARAMVLPSKAEPFGLVILEAWAAGAPVLASNTSGARSLIDDGANGWLFDLDKPETFHAKLDRTLTDAELARSLAATAKKLVREKYDAKKLAGDIKDLYSQLITDRCES